jgi:hypothetical protein
MLCIGMKTEDTLMKWLNAVRDAVTTAPALTIKNVSHYMPTNIYKYESMYKYVFMSYVTFGYSLFKNVHPYVCI